MPKLYSGRDQRSRSLPWLVSHKLEYYLPVPVITLLTLVSFRWRRKSWSDCECMGNQDGFRRSSLFTANDHRYSQGCGRTFIRRIGASSRHVHCRTRDRHDPKSKGFESDRVIRTSPIPRHVHLMAQAKFCDRHLILTSPFVRLRKTASSCV